MHDNDNLENLVNGVAKGVPWLNTRRLAEDHGDNGACGVNATGGSLAAACEKIADLIEDPTTPSELAVRMKDEIAFEMEAILRKVDFYHPTAIRRLYPILLAFKAERLLLPIDLDAAN